MDVEKLELLRNVIDAYGVKLWIMEEGEAPEFDDGLRRQVYQEYDYSYLTGQIVENCQPEKVYQVFDDFALHYIIFLVPQDDGGKNRYVIIGPYFIEQEKPDAVRIVEEMELELYQVQVLKNYYYGTTTVINLDNVVRSMLKMMYPDTKWKIEKTGISLREQQEVLKVRLQAENEQSMEVIEERYRCENEALEALVQGDIEKTEQAMGKLSKYRLEARNGDNLREAKNSMIIVNVLFRKAVEQAGVHPYYIDELSTSFAKRIETARNMIDIVNLNREFVRRYCLLVKNYALKGYSQVIVDCLNYIDFNLEEELTLNTLAERFSVNPSALSKKFKNELGQTLTDYVNQKRVSASLILLATTRLPIGEVAAQVGYLNENYYSRIFKKLQGMTPREYREIMTRKE